MKKYIAPETVVFCLQTENMLALSLISGQNGNTTVIDVDTDPTQQLTRGMGWNSADWTDVEGEDEF